jgi:hypothetical protein
MTSTSQSHASIDDDLEFNALKAAVMGASEGRETSRWDTPVCECCRRIDGVETTSRRESNATLKRHSCTRCGTHGATVVVVRSGPKPTTMWTAGDVQTVDLEQPEHADARGTGASSN